MTSKMKIVDFSKCKKCKHWNNGKEDDYDSPCPECLDNGQNVDTTDPIYFERNDNEF